MGLIEFALFTLISWIVSSVALFTFCVRGPLARLPEACGLQRGHARRTYASGADRTIAGPLLLMEHGVSYNDFETRILAMEGS